MMKDSDFEAKVSELNELASEELRLIVRGEKPYLTRERWRPVFYAAEAPKAGVTLGPGPLKTGFDRNIRYLNEWFEAKRRYAELSEPIGWEEHLPASSEGRMLGAAAHSLRWGEREDMRAIVDAIVGVVKARQRADGYCMPFDEQDMEASEEPFPD